MRKTDRDPIDRDPIIAVFVASLTGLIILGVILICFG